MDTKDRDQFEWTQHIAYKMARNQRITADEAIAATEALKAFNCWLRAVVKKQYTLN